MWGFSDGVVLQHWAANESLINGMKGMQISMTHVEDVCLAHIFVAEKASASGRYICCGANIYLCT